MSEDVLGYSSHDWRKHTHDALVVDGKTGIMNVNECKVLFKNPKTVLSVIGPDQKDFTNFNL